MKRVVAVLGMLLATLVTVTSPTLTLQEGGSMAALAGEGPPPPQYVLAADGTLTVGGDVVLSCNESARFAKQYGDPPPSYPFGQIDPEDARVWAEGELEGARAVVKECERVGFSPSGGTGAEASGPSGVEDAEGTPLGGVTEDGFVRTRYDTFVACGSGFPVVEQYAAACAEVGASTAKQRPDRQQETLPATGGPPLMPLLAALLVASGVLVTILRPRTS